MESLEDLGASISGPRPRDTAVPQDSSQLQPNRAWLRLFSDFMNNQKKFRGRTKKSGNSRGCFGMKLERIGTSSGLGCQHQVWRNPRSQRHLSTTLYIATAICLQYLATSLLFCGCACSGSILQHAESFFNFVLMKCYLSRRACRTEVVCLTATKGLYRIISICNTIVNCQKLPTDHRRFSETAELLQGMVRD